MDYYIKELEKAESEIQSLYGRVRDLLSEISSLSEHISMIKKQLEDE